MAEFEKKKHAQDEFNNGNKYVANDGVQPATINNLVENSLYTEAFAESLASTPDTTNAAQIGTPSVELVDNPSAGITGAKKFKFSNLKGEQGPGYFRANVSLDTTATSVPSSNINWGPLTEASVSDSIIDNNGNVFAVTARTAATSPAIPISYRTSIRGTAGGDGDSVFIRYSESSDGSNMTAAPAENTHYIGFYRGQSASNTASDYTWSQYVGKEISEVAIDEFSFVITYDDGTTSTAPLNTENCLLTYSVPSGGATAVTAYPVPSNADLNDYRGQNYWGRTFYAGDSNTVQNTPVAGIAFSLEVLRSGAFETVQRITINNQPTVYTRSVADSTATSADGTWAQWQEIAEANGTYPDMTVGNATNATNAAVANTLADSGKYTLLWSGSWDGESNLVVPGLSNYCAILVRYRQQDYVCYKTTNAGLGISYGFTEILVSDDHTVTMSSLVLNTTGISTGGEFSTLESAAINTVSFSRSSAGYGTSSSSISSITEIRGIETLRVPT